jgi:mRNA-degrading endonuclease RelE of RelBE toxin-antitoxin system
MSLTVVVQETAIRALARIRSEDKDAFAQIRRAMPALPDQPRPDAAVAWGDSGIYRLHLAGIRIGGVPCAV